MPAYVYRCTNCKSNTEIVTSIANYEAEYRDTKMGCDACMGSGTLKRVFDVPSMPPMFQPHYNHAAGRYVETERQLTDHFKEASDSATERTGVPHTFKAHDLRDPFFAATNEGLE